MITTVLGTCDLCNARDTEIVQVNNFAEETFACEECLNRYGLAVKPDDDYRLNALSHG